MSDDVVSLGANLALVDEMYAAFRRDPSSVDSSWRELFARSGRTVSPAARGDHAGNGGNGNAAEDPRLARAIMSRPARSRPASAPAAAAGVPERVDGDVSTRTRISRA